MSKPSQLTVAVLEAVRRIGRGTVAQIAAEVSHLISASQARHAWEAERRHYQKKKGGPKKSGKSNPILVGGRAVIRWILIKLTQRRLIQRPTKGVYAVRSHPNQRSKGHEAQDNDN